MRQRFAGSGLFVGAAGFFFLIGVFALLIEVQSPSFVLWTGIEVHGVTRDGVTYYSYDGERHVVDNPHAAPDESDPDTVVWLSRSHPEDESKAYIENPWNRWVELAFVAVWFLAALGFVVAGLLRAQLRMRRRIRTMGQLRQRPE